VSVSRLLRLGVATLLVVMLALAGVELWLRHQVHVPTDPSAQVFLRPPLRRTEVQVTRAVPGLAARTRLFTTNAYGLRADAVDLSDEKVTRIITLGGSVTECMVLADQDAWPRRMQDELARRTGKPVWVGNGGVSGQTSLDYAAHAQRLLPQFRPHAVVIMIGGNDLNSIIQQRYFPLDLLNPQVLAPYAEKLYVPSREAEADLSLLEPLYSYALYERRLAPDVMDLTDLYARMKELRFQAPKLSQLEELEDGVDTYRTNLRMLQAALAGLEPAPKVLLVTHPFLWADKLPEEAEKSLWGGVTCIGCANPKFYATPTLAAALREINRVTLEFCKSSGLACYDLEPHVPKTLANFYDDAHLTEQGAALVASLVAEQMVRLKVVR
jgi:lysophospholipase L1-like esterase